MEKLKKRVTTRGFVSSCDILEKLAEFFGEQRKRARIEEDMKEEEKKRKEKGNEEKAQRNPLFELFKKEYELKNQFNKEGS